MKKIDYLLKFRRCRTLNTLERVYNHMYHEIQINEKAYFVNAYNHRKEEIIIGKMLDKIPYVSEKK
ncbi:Hha/YmoA family nucleoid-associated regulatory protein [Candidatus Tachikawaea gelatinosa]|uniref:Hemolysin expression modulating familyprotein n=1 Tax=Candidatus Tachikawaea gelatinosa TaxID=1410383 RepID=A0A090AJV1_9ENTR|nr:Hha/YmoA family nucleoid-associated regulatory protein [Candidatus Tachikawaea gelatinosa]BAP58738.1 hemolysin expression modulating familyprotein [Candidatus Tachikawaea gelatinosa]